MISILLPSRRRPRNIARFIDSLYQNARSGDLLGSIEFLFYIDFCDELSVPELEYQKEEYKDLVNIRWIVGERKPISNTYNDLLAIIDKPDILMITGDDIICRSEGWDLAIYEAFAKYKDRLILVGGSDLFNDNLFTTFCLSKEFVDVTGFLMPDGMWDYADTTIWDIFSRINRIEKINVIFEHMHVSAGKGPLDNTMREKNILCYGGNFPSHLRYQSAVNERIAVAKKLEEKIKSKQ